MRRLERCAAGHDCCCRRALLIPLGPGGGELAMSRTSFMVRPARHAAPEGHQGLEGLFGAPTLLVAERAISPVKRSGALGPAAYHCPHDGDRAESLGVIDVLVTRPAPVRPPRDQRLPDDQPVERYADQRRPVRPWIFGCFSRKIDCRSRGDQGGPRALPSCRLIVAAQVRPRASTISRKARPAPWTNRP